MILLFAPQPMEEENVRLSNWSEQRNDHNVNYIRRKGIILVFSLTLLSRKNDISFLMMRKITELAKFFIKILSIRKMISSFSRKHD